MKNIIKRGTSLLLVLAMLLSFAAVVGAADERLPVEGEKPVTLSLDSVVLRQGSTDVQYVPVRLTIEPGFAITGFQLAAVSSDESAVEVTGFYPKRPLKIYEDGSVNYDETIGTIFGKLYSNYGSSESKDPVQKFACANGKGVTSETISTRAEDGVIKEPDLAGYIGVKVKDGAQSGAYQLSIIPNASRDRDTTKRNDIVFTIGTQNTYTDAYATLNAGTAIVLPEGVNLPTVILTDDTFAVPTWEQMQAKQDKYPLASRMKIVGNDNKLYDVDAESLVVSAAETLPDGVYLNDGKTLELATRAEANTTGISLTVKSAKAVDADISISAPATVTAKISKADRGVWKAGFATNAGYYVTDTSFEKSYSAPEYKTPEEAYKYLSLNPSAIDYYGKKVDNYGVTSAELEIYSDAQHQNRITTGDVLESVKFTDENCNSLKYGSLLKQDVWCRVRAVVTVDENTKLYGDWLEFQIVNKYPQAARATVVLGDMNGNEFPSGPVTTIDIPYGTTENKTFSIIVKDFRQADGKTMPEGTEPSATDVTIALDGTYTGVSISNDNKLVIDKTAQAGTVTVKATLNGKELGTLPLTLQKAASVVTELKLYDSATGKPKDGTEIEIKSGVTNGKATLPGIRANDELVLEFEPVCAIDQYGEIYQVEGKNFLRPSQYALYKQSSTNPEAYEICAAAERSVDAEGVVTATIKNSLDNDGTLLVQPGIYKFGTFDDNYNDNGFGNFDLNQKLMSEPFELVYGESEYTGTASYTGGAAGTTAPTVEVPYQYGTETKANTITVSADIKDQYNTTLVSDPYTYTLDEGSIKLNNKQIETGDITFDGESGLFTVNASAAKYFGDKTEIPLTATMTATYGTGENDKVDNIPISITLRKDASKLAHLKVTGTASDGTTGFTKEATILDKDETASYNLIVPNTGSRTYTITLSDVEDQYGTALTDRVSTSADVHSATYDNGILTINPQSAGGKAVLTLTESGTTTGHKVELTLNFAQMSFVNSDGADYKVDMWMNTNERTYGQDGKRTWAEVCTKWGVAAYPDVHIRTEDGKAGEKVTDKVKVVVKQNGEEVYDSFKTYTEAPKANAGDYTIELIYVKQEGAEAKKTEYPIDSTPFKITPKEVTIKVTGGTITKEYDGTQSLVLPSSVTLTIEGNPADLTVDPNALQYASENAGTGIKIELVPGKTCLTGAAAANYNVSLDGLTGTITPRKLIVTPKAETFEYGENDKITTALTTEFDYAGKNGDLPSGLTPSFTGSMVLTQSNAEVQSPYNAGDYYPRQGTLAVNSNNYEISEFKTTVNGTEIKWVVSPKTVDPFDVTLQAEYGINGSELYAMLNTAKVTVDGKEVNLSTVYNVNVLDIEDAGKNKVSRTGTDAVNAGEYTVTNWTLTTLGKNYTFNKVPTLKIKVKPHELTDADVQLSGETSAGFDGTEKSVMVKVSFTYGGREVTLTKDTDYTLTGEVEASNAGGHYLTVTAKPNGNLSGSVQKRWQIWPYEIQPGDLTFKLKSGVTFTYDTTPKKPQKSDVTWDVTATDAKRKAFLKTYFTEDDFNLDCLARTDAGDYTASASMRHNFVKSKEAFKMSVSWTIGKSSVTPLSNQTAKTKYGQPGSLTVTLSEGQYKGLTNGAWTVRDIGGIFESAVAEYKDGVVTINWKLKDTTKAGDTGSFKVTVPASTNYEGYEFTVTVNVTAKDAQTGFGFTYANPIVGYAEDTYTNPVQNAKTTPVYTSSNESVATVDSSSGVVTILDVGETIITAAAPEDAEYASATDSYTLTVVPSTLTVTASSATMTANDPVPSFTASVTGLKRGQTTAQVFQTLTASAATDGKTAGTYAVNASATLKTDFVPRYTLRFVPGTLTVNPAVTVIDTVLPIIIGGNTCANGYANCACESFYDLDASRWYHEAIDWAYSLGLMNGTTKSTFGPNAAATRAQTWTMLARIAGQDTGRSVTWYEVGQKWAMGLGITDGTNPMGSLTREQLAAMLYRYVGSPAVNGTLTFTDSANVSTWARNAMIWAVQNGILDGVGGNRLNPKGTTTRAQAAAIFMRFSKLINK